MSDPEISRRCGRCGATVRTRAQFCPQCGLPMTNQTHVAPPTANELRGVGGESSASDRQTGGVTETNTPPPRATGADATRVNQVLSSSPHQASTLPHDAPHTPASPNPNTVNRARVMRGESETAHDGRANPVQRAQRDIERDARPRAERLREATTEVLDEAADDPSLRFVLVSLLLFVVFVVLLLASTFVF